MSRFIVWAHVALFLAVFFTRPSVADEELERSMLALGPETIAAQAHFRGDARRGALLFFKSAAGCVKCHGSGPNQTPLGPDLTTITKETTDAQIVESILQPSKVIRKGFETVSVVTNDGKIITGLVARKDDNEFVLRDAANLEREIVIATGDIEEQKVSEQSMMPQQLVASLYSERDVYDLVRYVMDVARGGKSRAAELRPSPQQLVVVDDTEDLDHAGILRSLGERDYKAGQRIFFGHCQNCHGRDGNTPTLPTARAFGRQPLKYGADPLSMLKTLTRGAGLMSPMQHLTPRERYQVIHFIREEFMKPNNPVYEPVTDAYLVGLPKGSDDGEGSESGERDYGPVLGSQLGNQINNALTYRLPANLTISYDLHQMRVAGAWEGGFLNLSQTQHYRQRGERMPQIEGELLPGLGVWQWAYGGSFDIPANVKPPRGPLPSEFMQYHGHYLYGNQAILSYSIEGRRILETVTAKRVDQIPVFTHTLRVEPSDRPLRLAVAGLNSSGAPSGLYSTGDDQFAGKTGDAAGNLAMISGSPKGNSDQPRMANRALQTVKGEKAKELDLGTPDRTTLVRFRTKESGTLIASTPERGEWKPNGKSLFVRGGRLVFDIGWVGAMTSRLVVNDGEWHVAAIVVTEETTRLFVDGKLEVEREAFRRPAEPGFVLKIGATSTNFGGDYSGDVEAIRIVNRAISNDELAKLKQLPGAEGEDVLFSWAPSKETPKQPADTSDLVLAGAMVNGNVDGLTWEIDDANRIVVNIPAGKEPRVLSVTRSAALGALPATITKTLAAAKVDPVDLATRTSGGPARWSDTLEVRGQLGESINGYALDTIPVPFENPWNAWMRTSALDFFPDGRCVVTTHGGDVWIVSGIDRDLNKVTWKRFTAGLFEPFGVRVVDNQIYVTCRDGIKRLHDFNGDDEADFIEAFWVDDDVSSSFHAYNFDLQTDAAGNFYFAKAGQYTQHHRPGTIMRVPLEGGRAEVVAWGLRTPNGMGRLADDRFTV
ncbi:MAG: c-type cytochrome, partial [Planctomycetaceae bacterium]|nr:c-type cytochrome [Planctomycetaceae bacterium]